MTEKNAQVCCWVLDSTFPNGQGEVDLAMLVVARPGWDCQNARLKFGFFSFDRFLLGKNASEVVFRSEVKQGLRKQCSLVPCEF